MRADLLIRRAQLATFDPNVNNDGYGTIAHAAIALHDGRIVWRGADRDLPADLDAKQELDAGGRWLTPGLIDCHTHLVYAGHRADEFEMRLNGVGYEEIARAGLGIRSTVRATRSASEEELLQQSLPRLRNLMNEGVATVEIKSGYGLNMTTERAQLRTARKFHATQPIHVSTTFLGAHALPEEFVGRADDYIDHLIAEILPVLAHEGLIDAVDAFCETIGFTPAQVTRLFDAARALNLPVKLHAEQLSDRSGGELVARYRGLSADHLEWLSDTSIAAMAQAGTVAVLLPVAFYCLHETRLPPIAALRAAGVPMAVATDCNPGTAPCPSILLALNMACTLFRLTPAEALAGVTREAARALGLQHDRGRIAIGQRGDLALWSINHPAELCYHLGYNPLALRIFNGAVPAGAC
ncbi:MAG: imidazolonepropionase [Gammaproteobacteria bacterium]|nr:imidazolonepropionase [Gammaproteobacteria bacterium]